MRRVAIFGGSFNPVHQGHVAIAETALDKDLADEVWFMPCRRNPLKESNNFCSDSERVRLLREAVSETEVRRPEIKGRLMVSELELGMPEPSYTVDTMKFLSERYPDVEFSLLMGGDSLAGFKRWREWKYIKEHWPLIVYPRPGIVIPPENLEGDVILLEGVREYSVSSTEIRESVKEGKERQFMKNTIYGRENS